MFRVQGTLMRGAPVSPSPQSSGWSMLSGSTKMMARNKGGSGWGTQKEPMGSQKPLREASCVSPTQGMPPTVPTNYFYYSKLIRSWQFMLVQKTIKTALFLKVEWKHVIYFQEPREQEHRMAESSWEDRHTKKLPRRMRVCLGHTRFYPHQFYFVSGKLTYPLRSHTWVSAQPHITGQFHFLDSYLWKRPNRIYKYISTIKAYPTYGGRGKKAS